MKAVCPNNPDHKRFSTVAHVMESWIVDPQGNFIEVEESLQTTHKPDPGNTWTCVDCGAIAQVDE